MRLGLLGVSILLLAGTAGCGSQQRVASPEGGVVAIVTASNHIVDQSWSITAEAQNADQPYLVACLSTDAGGPSFETMRWVKPRTLQIDTGGGSLTIEVDARGQRVGISDPDRLNGLC